VYQAQEVGANKESKSTFWSMHAGRRRFNPIENLNNSTGSTGHESVLSRQRATEALLHAAMHAS
jgi:hypothetical protein